MDNTEEMKNISKEKTKKKKEKPVRVKKVKSAKPAKAPKQKKEKAPKETGKKGVKAKESKKKVPKQKSEIPFYHSIAMRLIASFLLPVVGVLVLAAVLGLVVKTIKNKDAEEDDFDMEEFLAEEEEKEEPKAAPGEGPEEEPDLAARLQEGLTPEQKNMLTSLNGMLG